MKRAVSYVLWLMLVAAGSRAETNALSHLWQDAEFLKRFMGSYGFKSDIEPQMTAEESSLMERLGVVMGTPEGSPKAARFLEKYISARPNASAVFDFTLGNIAFQAGELARASTHYEGALSKFPDFLRAHKNIGVINVQTGSYDRAVGALTRAIALGDREGLTFGLLGYSYAMSSRPLQAETAYREAMMLQPETLDWTLGLTRTLFSQQRFEEVVALCDTLLEGDPGRLDYLQLQASAYLGMQRFLKAAELYEQMSAMEKAAAATLHTLGDIYVNEGVPDMAADAYLRALKQGGVEETDHTLRNVEVLASKGANADAARLIAALREQAGGAMSVEARKRMLKVEARIAAASGVAEAEQALLLNEMVALDPLDGEAIILLAQHHASTGAVEQAAFLFERAAGMEAFEADAKLRYGQMLVREGQYKEAVPLLKRSQELNPRASVEQYLEQVERVARGR